MPATAYGWLVLAFPLAGTLIISLGWRFLPSRSAGWIGTAMIALSFLASIGALVQILGDPVDARHLGALGREEVGGRPYQPRGGPRHDGDTTGDRAAELGQSGHGGGPYRGPTGA